MGVPKSDKFKSILPPPLNFSGKSTLATFQTRVDARDRVAPTGLVPFQPRGEELPVSVLLHHFDRCHVEGIVRLVEHSWNNWVLSPTQMDHPDSNPWFLICGIKDVILTGGGVRHAKYLIVNENFEFYPIVYIKDPNSTDSGEFQYELCHIIRADSFKDYVDYSEIDRLMIDSAVQSFLRHKGWLT